MSFSGYDDRMQGSTLNVAPWRRSPNILSRPRYIHAADPVYQQLPSVLARLRAFRHHDIHVLGSFIFGLPTDDPQTFEATVALAEKADLTFAPFLLLTPFPGTVDFEKWASDDANRTKHVGGIPVTQHWLIPEHRRPRLYVAHPTMSLEEIRTRTQDAWDRFYSWHKVWARSRVVESVKARLAFVLVSKLYRQMYANTGIATEQRAWHDRIAEHDGSVSLCGGGCRKNSLPASLRRSPRFDAAILIRLRQRFTSCVARSGAVTV